MKQIVRIVAAVVDTRNMTLYREDGTTITIPQGDPRLRRIVDESAAHLKEHGWADVDISDEEEGNPYAEFQATTNGFVKLFRVAKAKLAQLLALGLVEEAKEAPVEPTQLGQVPVVDETPETFEPVPESMPAETKHTMDAINEIIAHATPVTSERFNEEGIEKQRPITENGVTPQSHPAGKAEDTIIAVVDGKVIPGMERIKSQFARAAKNSSPEGVQRFLQRIGSVIEQRSHSVDDLLKFMERGDLPIADDGSILIYKVLCRDGNKYVDCHTRKVQQFIGAYVCMDPSLVDHDRNNECSNGLHVARRGYISSFSGDVCVLAKLAPEDVITVPSYDANKMRVCGYHILFELTDSQYSLVKRNKPLTEDEAGKLMLARAMRGEHIHKTHEVRIRGSYGGNVLVTKLDQPTPPVLAPAPIPAEPAQEEALADNGKTVEAPVVPAQVEQVIEQAKSRKEQARELYVEWENAKPAHKDTALANLLAFKKACKIGWDRLGIPDPTAKTVHLELPGTQAKQAEVIKSVAPKQKAERIVEAHKVQAAMSEKTPRERIAKLLAIGLDKQIAQKVLDIKKAAKKNWQLLGVSEKQVKQILKLTDTK